MRTVFVLFDSLNRLALGAYGGEAIATPNFDRFAKRSVTFDNHYVGSLPCMPARRDMHTGRLNFTHRHWGPLEPFDNSFAKILSAAGTYTHLISDHLHYFEEGGCGYTNAFDSWEFIRGQEYDTVKAMVEPPLDRLREKYDDNQYPTDGLATNGAVTKGNSPPLQWARSRNMVTRMSLKEESDYPTAKCFASAFDFLQLNKDADDWFLQLECFDPHEPFVAPERFKDAYRTGYNGKILDWPLYDNVTNSAEEIAEIRGNYAALVAMCDEYFGKLLDYFDEYSLWDDTCLILTTDHGFLLSEHEWWAKNRMPYYEEISHIPLMIWHPQAQDRAGERYKGLTQTPDLMPTFLELAGADVPPETTGTSLLGALMDSDKIRDIAVFGMFSGPLGMTDGRYAYYHYPENLGSGELNLYTLMPAHLRKYFDFEELKTMELVEPFDFTKGVPVMKIRMNPANSQLNGVSSTADDLKSALYDLREDPRQEKPIDAPEIVERLLKAATRELVRHDTPPEIFTHFGLPFTQNGSAMPREITGTNNEETIRK